MLWSTGETIQIIWFQKIQGKYKSYFVSDSEKSINLLGILEL